jgi:hypothetical protein
MPSKEELLEAMRDNRKALGELLNRVQQSDLSLPVYPEGWTVNDLLCHFASLSYQMLPQRYLSPPSQQASNPGAAAADIDARNKQEVERRSGRSLAELREEIELNTAKIEEMLSALEGDQLETSVSLSWLEGTFADLLQAIIVNHEKAHVRHLGAALQEQS